MINKKNNTKIYNHNHNSKNNYYLDNPAERFFWVVIVVVTSFWVWHVIPLTNHCVMVQMSRSDVTSVKKGPQQKIREKRSELPGIRTGLSRVRSSEWPVKPTEAYLSSVHCRCPTFAAIKRINLRGSSVGVPEKNYKMKYKVSPAEQLRVCVHHHGEEFRLSVTSPN